MEKLMALAKRNAALYRKLSEPFATREEAVAAVEAFWEDVYAIREKHRMRDVYVVCAFSWKDGDDEGDQLVPLSIGDVSKARTMAAWANGYETAAAERDMDRLVALARKQASKGEA